MYEASWYHRLHQLAVLLLPLDPRLSDSSGGLPSSFGHILFILGFHHVTLIFILTADWQVQTVVQKDGSLTNQQFPRFKCSAHEGVQKYFYIIWTRGPNTM